MTSDSKKPSLSLDSFDAAVRGLELTNESEPTASVVASGLKVKHYQIVEAISHGTQGRVYLAEDTTKDSSLGRHLVALKIMRSAMLSAEVPAKRFAQEAVVMSEIRHPNVINVLDRGEYEGLGYIVMEYLPGAVTLKERLDSDGPLPVEMADVLFEQGLRALAEIHSKKGRWHRDIKPGNILIYQTSGGLWLLKVIDFGIAHAPDQELTNLGETPGTVNYMSPEMFKGEADYRSDLYAYGVTFYRALTGGLPYASMTGITGWQQHHGPASTRKRVIPPTEIRPELNQGWDYLLLTLIETLEHRYQSAQAALEDFANRANLPKYEGALIREGGAAGEQQNGEETSLSRPAAKVAAGEAVVAEAVDAISAYPESHAGDTLVLDAPPEKHGAESSANLIAEKLEPASASGLVNAALENSEPCDPPTHGDEVDATEAGFGLHLQKGGGLGSASEETPNENEAEEDAAPLENIAEAAAKKARLKRASLVGGVIVGWLALVVVMLEPWGGGTDEPPAGAKGRTSGEPSVGFPQIKLGKRRGAVTDDEVDALFRRNRQVTKANASEPAVDQATATEELEQQSSAPVAPTPKAKRRRSAAKTTAPVPAAPPAAPEKEERVETEEEKRWRLELERRERLKATLGNFGHSGRRKEEKAAKASKSKGLVRIGTKIKAELNVGISSMRHGEVLATVLVPVKEGTRILVPKGAIVKGRSSSTGDDRIHIQFRSVIIGKEKHDLIGNAISGGHAGLKAKVKRLSLAERQKRRAGNTALETTSEVTGEVIGIVSPTAGRIAGKLGEGAADEAQRENEIDRSEILTVAAKTKFKIQVTGP